MSEKPSRDSPEGAGSTGSVTRMSKRSPVLGFGALTALFAAGYGVMFTVLDDWRDEFGISESRLGWIVGIGFFASFVAQVLIAPLADRGHARLLLYLGLAMNLAGLFGMAFGETFWVFIGARVLMGIGVGAAYPAVRRIVILAEPERLGHNIGRLISADVGGFALGPALGAALVGPFGLASPFLVLAAGTVVAVLWTARVHVEESVEVPESRFAFDLLRRADYAGVVILGAGLFLMIATFDTLWALVLDELGSPDWIAGVGVTLFALPFILLGSVGGRLAERFGAVRWAALGLLTAVVALLAYGRAGSGPIMLTIAVCHATCDGLTTSATGIAVGRVAPPERQAAAQGMLGGVQTLVGGLTASAAGALYDAHGRRVTYSLAAGAVFVTTLIGSWLARSVWSDRGAAPAADGAVVELV